MYVYVYIYICIYVCICILIYLLIYFCIYISSAHSTNVRNKPVTKPGRRQNVPCIQFIHSHLIQCQDSSTQMTTALVPHIGDKALLYLNWLQSPAVATSVSAALFAFAQILVAWGLERETWLVDVGWFLTCCQL